MYSGQVVERRVPVVEVDLSLVVEDRFVAVLVVVVAHFVVVGFEVAALQPQVRSWESLTSLAARLPAQIAHINRSAR